MAIKRIDHIAIVVPNIEEALSFYQGALGLKLEHTERLEDQDVIVAFLPTGESEIELVEPVNPESGVARYLDKRGPGIHHICLQVDDIRETLAQLRANGVELINDEPTIGSGGKSIAFIHPNSANGVLVELYEETAGEMQRRRDTVNDLRERLAAEGQAVAAGVMAFMRALRADAGLTNGDGIRITADDEE